MRALRAALATSTRRQAAIGLGILLVYAGLMGASWWYDRPPKYVASVFELQVSRDCMKYITAYIDPHGAHSKMSADKFKHMAEMVEVCAAGKDPSKVPWRPSEGQMGNLAACKYQTKLAFRCAQQRGQ